MLREVSTLVVSRRDLQRVHESSLVEPDYFDAAIIGSLEEDDGECLVYSIEDMATLYAAHAYPEVASTQEAYDASLAMIYENFVDAYRGARGAPVFVVGFDGTEGDDEPVETFGFVERVWRRA